MLGLSAFITVAWVKSVWELRFPHSAAVPHGQKKKKKWEQLGSVPHTPAVAPFVCTGYWYLHHAGVAREKPLSQGGQMVDTRVHLPS